MSVKTIVAKIASWFKAELKPIETRIVIDAAEVKKVVDDAIQRIEVISEEAMNTPAVVPSRRITWFNN